MGDNNKGKSFQETWISTSTKFSEGLSQCKSMTLKSGLQNKIGLTGSRIDIVIEFKKNKNILSMNSNLSAAFK